MSFLRGFDSIALDDGLLVLFAVACPPVVIDEFSGNDDRTFGLQLRQSLGEFAAGKNNMNILSHGNLDTTSLDAVGDRQDSSSDKTSGKSAGCLAWASRLRSSELNQSFPRHSSHVSVFPCAPHLQGT